MNGFPNCKAFQRLVSRLIHSHSVINVVNTNLVFLLVPDVGVAVPCKFLKRLAERKLADPLPTLLEVRLIHHHPEQRVLQANVGLRSYPEKSYVTALTNLREKAFVASVFRPVDVARSKVGNQHVLEIS